MKMLSKEELDRIESMWKRVGWLDSPQMNRILHQARLAPVWRKGTEPPETNKACLCIRNGKEYEDFRRSTGEWFETGDAPDLWCYKPTPPESSDE